MTALISCRRQTAREEKTAGPKLKAMQETILRMNEKNVRLTAENKSLKEDLENVMEESAKTKAKNGKDCYSEKLNDKDNSFFTHWFSCSSVLIAIVCTVQVCLMENPPMRTLLQPV